jgi:gluconolactonase
MGPDSIRPRTESLSSSITFPPLLIAMNQTPNPVVPFIHSMSSRISTLSGARWHSALLVVATIACSGMAKAQTPASIGRLEALDPAFEQLVAADARIEVLAGGFTWTEGPVWVQDASGGYLLFSDIPRNTIFKWSQASGVETFLQPSGYTGNTYYGLEPGSNGLALDKQGRLLACEHGDRRVSVLTAGGGKMTLADSFEGRRLNSPNDLVVHSSGSIFFTDPPYGLPSRADDPRRELDFCGVYRLDADGRLALLTKQLARPNGIGLSPDEKTLYVAQSDPSRAIWMSFPIADDLTIGEGKVMHDATDQVGALPGLPDGMCVDPQGNIWASGPGGIYCFDPAGKLLGRLLTGERTSNCTLGGPDGKTLYITADSYLCRVSVK